MVLKGLRAVLGRKRTRSTRIAEIEMEADIPGTGDTRTLPSVNSDIGGRTENVKDFRIGLKWLRAIFRRRGRYEHEDAQTETETPRRTTTRTETETSSGTTVRTSLSADLSAGESAEVIEHYRRGPHRFRAMLIHLTQGRLSRLFPGLEREREWSSSYYTGSTTSSVVPSIVPSEDLSISDPGENRLLLTQEVTMSRIYRRLEDFEIRVLEVLPGDEEIVRCRLKYTSLIAPRDYNALSYTWGTTSQLRYIIVNGYHLQVTENCEAALRELRREISLKQKQQIIWVDAICINQTDVSERTQQVRLMRHIYHKCQKLIVWLGPEGDGSSDAVKSMKAMAAALDDGTIARLGLEMDSSSDAVKSILATATMTAALDDGTIMEWVSPFITGPNHIEQWVSLKKLLSRSWFTRAWVFQEYVVCARKALSVRDIDAMEFYCGKERISPHEMGATDANNTLITYVLVKHGPSVGEHAAAWQEGGHLFFRGLQSLTSLTNYSELGVLDPMEFFRCILSNLYRSATDPRDHIYAYLGFCKEIEVESLQAWENMVPSFSDLIVDYGASLEDVYSSLVRLLVSASGRLDVLSMCYKGNSQIKTSWALDLQYIASLGLPLNKEYHRGLLASQFLKKSGQRRYFASKDKVETAYFSNEAATLLVEGIRFELVYTVFDTGHWDIMTTRRPLIEDVSRLLAKLIGKTIEEARRLLWNVSVGGTSFKDKSSYYESWIKWLDAPSVSGLGDESDSHEHWAKLMRDQSPDRVKFVLKGLTDWRPTRIGKGWKTMRENDIVCIVFGCDVPLVLRPVDDHFELIGDCFVEGIMEGQAMALFENEEVKKELFLIR
ncbi:heterokaryon incompatibility protein-domain-containing protein [Halenospora varia]|nr:heterokaryon incompatibility protein-domain-containing protein [Halenospora varia]